MADDGDNVMIEVEQPSPLGEPIDPRVERWAGLLPQLIEIRREHRVRQIFEEMQATKARAPARHARAAGNRSVPPSHRRSAVLAPLLVGSAPNPNSR